MADQDRIDTLTANAWAAMYREGDKVDFNEACEVIHNAEGYPALVPLVLQALQAPTERQRIADAVLEALMGVVRDEYDSQVQQILSAEAERDELWRSCRMTPEQAERLDQMLDDPRHEEARAMKAGGAV